MVNTSATEAQARLVRGQRVMYERNRSEVSLFERVILRLFAICGVVCVGAITSIIVVGAVKLIAGPILGLVQ
jgi:nitrate reductase NapE component